MLKLSLRSVLPLLIGFAMLTSCTESNPVKDLAKAHLERSTGAEAGSIKILEISEPAPWMASDSAAVLEEGLDSLTSVKLDHLYKAVELSKEAIASAEESKKSGFTALYAMADQTIAESEQTIKVAKELIEKLESGDFTGTDLEVTHERIKAYKADPGLVLFNSVSGKYSADGGEPLDFKIMVNKELTEVI